MTNELPPDEPIYGHLTETWCWRFMRLAKEIAGWSKDPSTKCGAVIVDCITRDILGEGYNGFPPKVEDTEERLNNRDLKYPIVLHAEDNALWRARKHDLKGHAIFMWPGPSCTPCASKIIRAELGAVFFPEVTPDMHSRWGDSASLGWELFNEAKVRQIMFPHEDLVTNGLR